MKMKRENKIKSTINDLDITVGSKDPSGVVNAAFYLSPSLILTLLYPHLRSIFVKTFFIPIFSNTSNIKGRG